MTVKLPMANTWAFDYGGDCTLRVLHVYRTYFPDPPGGLQEAIRQICGAIRPFGFENVVFALSPKPAPAILERPETAVVRSRSWGAPASCDIGGVESIRKFSELAAAVDVVHYHFPWPFGDLLHLASRIQKPCVMTYHSDIVRQRVLGRFYRPIMMRTLLSMSSIVATSPAYARTSSVLGEPGVVERVRIIPLGMDQRTYPGCGDEGVFNRLGLERRCPYFLFVGVLRYYKGLQYLIRAAGKVDAQVVIAGSGPESEALHDLARTTGARNVLFAGQVSDEEKLALYKECCALVLPSHLRSEAYGMVLVEAAMFGKPMISCEIGTGTSFVNAHEETGFVVAPEAPDELARAMNALLADERMADDMGRAARARYERLFSGEALGRGYADLFREVAR